MATSNARKTPPNVQGYDLLVDIMVKHLERIDDILDKQTELNQRLSNEQTATRTRLDDTIKVLAWVAGTVAALLVAVVGGIIVYWLTHPH